MKLIDKIENKIITYFIEYKGIEYSVKMMENGISENEDEWLISYYKWDENLNERERYNEIETDSALGHKFRTFCQNQ
jgi:hypothetical protein